MEVLAVLVPFVLLGIAVLFVAFSGGPAAAREAYLTRGNRPFRVLIPLLYVGLGVGVPALVIAGREEAEGGVGPLRQAELTAQEEHGKDLFLSTCASCHDLDAVNARGVTGPDLDEIGQVDEQRVLRAIRRGGTCPVAPEGRTPEDQECDRRMPAGLLAGEDARDVAVYVAKVAGR